MKDLNKEIRLIKTVFRIICILVIITGLGFSYLIAELDDAPGIILIGTVFTLTCASFIYGFSEIITGLKKNNELLSSIYNDLKSKNK